MESLTKTIIIHDGQKQIGTPAAFIQKVSHQSDRPRRPHVAGTPIHGDTFSISALHLSIKVPYFSNGGHKNEKVTPYRNSRS
eukprot:SAG31_NODE_3790_length_3878_cov_1.766931_6_plen_82_part_00